MIQKEIIEDAIEAAKVNAMREIAWKVHCMISVGKSIAEIDHYVCDICFNTKTDKKRKIYNDNKLN